MKIIVLVDPLGNTQTIVKGVAGPSCRDASAFLEPHLGTIIEDVPTEEYSALPIQEEVQDANTTSNNLRRVNRIY